MDAISYVVKFNAQTAGRDKLFRLIQYGSRALWGVLAQLEQLHVLKGELATTIDKSKSLEYFLSNARKLLRFGKSLELLVGALRNIHAKDAFVRFALVAGKINQSIYLLVDHLILFGRLRLAAVDARHWGEVSARFWLATLILNLSRDVYEFVCLVQQYGGGGGEGGGRQARRHRQPHTLMLQSLRTHRALLADTVKNACDVCLPLSSLGKVRLGPHTVGLLGLVSSLIGILQLVNADYKLNPS